jgi:membrane protein implicated in regulation of membrane protease activity
MFSKLTRMDRFGVFLCAALLGTVVFLWWIGWAALSALLIAALAVLVFLFIVIWIGNQNDDDETNDDLGSAVAELKGEAQTAWQRARTSVTGKST